ncbi:MAG TPA: RDD family protein [Gaiellaceae bacterium]|jgi:uncharacterized RDD family membrane protein YckC|nr:RDD family protein [Gaiellaceae bacterium]
MEPPADEGTPDGPSTVGDAIGGATVFPARVAARVLRGPLETAVEDLLSAPEVGRILDRALSGPLPEELALSLARHQVVERVLRKLAANGELDRLLDAALASPRTFALLDRVLASDETREVLERVVAGPEVRAALTAQSVDFADQVAGGVRHAATGFDRRLALRPSKTAQFAGLASRGVALVVDALAIVTASVAIGAAAGLVGSLVGGVHPQWLAQSLLSLAAVGIFLGYFSLFWSTVGQTPGMRLMHLYVVPQRTAGQLTLWRALVRTVGLALAIIPCFLGFVPALFDRRRRALPDYLAGTVVVYGDHDGRAAG